MYIGGCNEKQTKYTLPLKFARTICSKTIRWNRDVVIPETMVVECKTTIKSDAKSWSIKREWLEQNEKERLDLMLPHSALAVSLDPSGENNLYVINENLMKILVKCIRGEETI